MHSREMAESWRERSVDAKQADDESYGMQGGTEAPASSVIQRDLRAAVLAALGDRQTAMRAAALRSLPVVMESGDMERVIARFEDPVRALRYDAIMTLGAMAGRSGKAVRRLLHLAEDKVACEQIGAYARPATRLALAMAYQRSKSESLRRMIAAAIVRFAETDDSRDQLAAFVAAEVGDIDVSESALNVFAGDEQASVDSIYRAALSLDSKNKVVRGPLLRALGGRDRVLRRAATWSLSRDASDLARANLATAFEYERGLFGRQTALVALAACREPQSRDLLVEQVKSGRKPLRAWASLGLALWLRNAGEDRAAHGAILAAYENEHNAANKPAHLLAVGLSKHPEAASILIPILHDQDASANERAFAAEGLALLGPVSDEIRAAFLHALAEDPCVLTRSAIAAAFAKCAAEADAAKIVAVVRQQPESGWSHAILADLGRRGGEDVAAEMRGLHLDEEASVANRAAALAAWGRALSDHVGLEFSGAAARADFSSYPGWLAWALRLGD